MQLTPELFVKKLKFSNKHYIDIDRRIIYIKGYLDSEIGTSLRLKFNLIKDWWDNIEKEKFTDITLDICSEGGDIDAIYAGIDFYYDLEKYYGIKVNTRGQGICMSAATLLLSAGTGIRSAFPKCRFMFHDIYNSPTEGTATQLKKTFQDLEEEQENFFALYAKCSRKGVAFSNEQELSKEARKFKKLFTKNNCDYFCSSEEVLKLKLIDKIL